MKYLILFLFLLSLTGCGAIDRFSAHMTGDASEICVRGVLYYQFTSGAAVALDHDGDVITCED